MIASNLDQSLLVATLKNPKTSSGFIDRFLVSCETYHIPAIIAFNKSDLYGPEEMERYAYLKSLYNKIGYQVLLFSAKEQSEIKALLKILEGKKTLISGHSGVGKSTLINVLMPGKDLKVMEVSDWSGKGMHTTTFAEMYDLNNNSKIIDTPGIRELGIVDVAKEELSGYFPEMRDRLQNCKFNNCLHLNEPQCAVQEAVIDGEIDEERFSNYMSILGSY